jgi:excisionase family DNA binding protein
MSRLLTTTRAAHALGVSPEWIRKLVDQGKLPAERTTNGVRILREEDVQALAREREIKARAGGGEE